MPIPTDTYWNIKRLNVVFAISAVVLLAVTGWAILQDFNQPWREPQRQGKVWEAALVQDKLESETTPEKEARLKLINQQIEQQEDLLAQRGDEIGQIEAQIRALESDQATMQFGINTLKANVTVDESQLQDAIAAGDTATEKRLRAKLETRRKTLAEDQEALAAKKDELAEARAKLKTLTASVDELTKLKARLTSDAEATEKKLNLLQPQGLLANLSQRVREAPLLQFLNPVTRVQQVVLHDVLTEMPPMRVPTIDRCTTCHVNVANREFTEPKVIAYLEQQVALSRGYRLPTTASGRSSDPAATRAAPGAVAMPEFWHLYAATVAPQVVNRPAGLNRLKTLAATVGKQATVTVDGKKLASFTYAPDPAKPADAASLAMDDSVRDSVVAALLQAWIGYGSGLEAVHGPVEVTLVEGLDDKALAAVRTPALKYVEDIHAALMTALPTDQSPLLTDRYRRALIADANIGRREEGLPALDPSRVMLAHPRLDLYVDIDSPHSYESVGCTSCHDGSGQETNFVLTAHSPRPIWVDEETGAPVLTRQIEPQDARNVHHDQDLSSMLRAVFPNDALIPGVSEVHLGAKAHAKPRLTTQPAPAPAPAPGTPAHAEVGPAPSDYDAALNTAPLTYVDPLSGETARAVPQMRRWIEAYEPAAPRSFKLVYHEWDWPMRPPKYLQANCVRCHADVNDIREEAPQVFEGKSLFVNMGCGNCHQMDSIPPELPPDYPSDTRLILANGQRKVGTDLRNVTAKLSPSFINTWIWAPKSFRPSTKMPHFFMLENNSSDEELRRTRQEARAMTEYLVRTANTYPQSGPAGAVAQTGEASASLATGPLPPLHAIPPGGKGSVDAGRIVFNSIGCKGCHTNLGDATGKTRGDKPVTLGEQWIVNDLVKSGQLAEQLETETGKRPDTKTLTAAATQLYDQMTYNERHVYVTEHLSADYSGNAQTYPDGTVKPQFQQHGPEISGVGTKLTTGRTPEQARAWLFDWLKNPQHYSEYTVMPQLRLNDQQALDLAEYLLAQKRPDDWKADLTPVDTPKLIELTSLFLRSRFSAQRAVEKADEDAELLALATDALTTANTPSAAAKAQAASMSKDERRMVFLGKKLISHYGCMSCHAINGTETLTSPCTNLSDWGKKALSMLDFGYLDHHKLEGLPPTSTVPMVNGLSAKASSLVGAEWRANFADGKVAGPVEVAWPHVDHSRVSWLTQKLSNTRAYDRGRVLLEPNPEAGETGKPYDKLKMPTFYLNDREVDALATWVIAQRGPSAEDRLITSRLLYATTDDEARTVSRGRQLAQKFNCVGCHVIDGNDPSVHQFFNIDEIVTKAPPSLRGEGNKIQHAWLFNFLKHVEPLRPLLNPPPTAKPEIRMPSFPITDLEADAVAAYFHAESVREAKTLNRQLAPVRSYLAAQQPTPAAAQAGRSTTTAPATATAAATASGDAIPPGEDWFTLPNFAGQVEFLRDWALDNKQISAIQLDPARNKPAELARSWKTILFKAEFVAELFDAPYPFVDDSRSRVDPSVYSEAQFKKGEAFFYEMQCLKCHVLGDPSVEGAQQNPTAPNLSLAQRRLQRRWVRHWVQEPAIIQAGTAMPPFFTGLAVFDLDGLPWPRSQGSSEQECLRAEKLYGQTADVQADLVLDFLYAAGLRGYTGVQPPTAEPPGATAPAATTPATPPPASTPPASTPPETPPAPTPAPPAAPTPTAPAAETGTDSRLSPAPPAQPPQPAPPAQEKPPAAPAAPQGAPGGASITGTVVFTGEAPEPAEIDMSGVKECAAHHADPVPEETLVVGDGGTLKNVVVYVSDGLEAASFPPPAESAVLDQKGCMYEPHVLPVMVGQKIMVRNDDPFLHNVHALSTINPAFNFGQPNKDPGKAIEPLKAAETFRVKCDVHPWMSAWVVGLENPYFAASGDDGKFSIPGLPPGQYTLTAWHEQLGTQDVPVTVERGKPTAIKIEFAAP